MKVSSFRSTSDYLVCTACHVGQHTLSVASVPAAAGVDTCWVPRCCCFSSR